MNKKLKVLLKYYYENSKKFDVHNNGKILKFPKIDEKLKEDLKNENDEFLKNKTIHNTKLITKIFSPFATLAMVREEIPSSAERAVFVIPFS